MMKRLSLLLVSCVVSLWTMAADVTPDAALQQAAQFLQSKNASGRRGAQNAPGVAPRLTLAGRVHDLYVFNADGDQGFVIVSNDDVAMPILGYSDTGSLNPQDIPANMRAWLLGYADEIAWAKQHNVNGNSTAAQQRRAAAVKKPIEPLIVTKWNQDKPYNDLCPDYNAEKKCATGCVATAMAQCMYYTEMRAGSTTTAITQDIPGYTTQTRKITMPGISAGTEIRWQDLAPNYSNSSSYTQAQAEAIAQLMYYCGISVEMDYGLESGANAGNVSKALVNYFGYKNTTQFVERDSYSYADWIEIMYHELTLNRPVCMSGAKTSGSGGHEFVLDGYQGEDFFHFNWGWGA